MSSNDQEKVDEAELDVEAGEKDASTPTTCSATATGSSAKVEEEVDEKDHKKPTKKNSVFIDEGDDRKKDDHNVHKDEEEDDPVVAPATNNKKKSNSNRVQLSHAFYCPITKGIFQDPVVASDGTTYERQAILQRDAGDGDVAATTTAATLYYRNRALQQVISDRLSTMDYSIRSKLLRLQKSMKSQLGLLLEQTPLASSTRNINRLPLPEAYYCPITFGLMHDPVIDPEGNTFERRAIQTWIRANQNSPLTRTALTESQLYDNQALYQVLTEEAQRSDGSIHPSIRKWKEEPTLEPLPPVDSSSSAAGAAYPTTLPELAVARERERQRLEQQNREYNGSRLFCASFALLVIFAVPYGLVWVIILVALMFCYEAAQQNDS